MSIEQRLTELSGDLPPGISQGVALGTGLADGYDLFPSPVGDVVVTFNPLGVSSVSLADEDFPGYFTARHRRHLLRAEPPSAWGRYIPVALEAGTPGKLPVDLRSVTAFQSQILRIAWGIPRGEVRPYGWLAREAHRPGATRAVGSTMARNPVPLIIPCHRVIRSDGQLGAYSLGGADNKWELLKHEGADPGRLQDLARHHVRVQANTSTGVYCHPSCHRIRESKDENVVGFSSAGEAEGAGYRACKLCRPG